MQFLLFSSCSARSLVFVVIGFEACPSLEIESLSEKKDIHVFGCLLLLATKSRIDIVIERGLGLLVE